MTSEYEDTGRGSTYEQESVVTGPCGEGGLSARRLGEANAGAGRPKHPALFALVVLVLAIVAIVVLVLLFVYL